MTPTFDEAVSTVTGAGERFETTHVVIDGIDQTVFVNAVPTLRDLFGLSLKRADRTFLVYEDERWSFADVMLAVNALGHLLVNEYGVEKGDRVAIGMRNFPEWIVSFAAITSVGAIAVSLNAWWTLDELAFALRDSSPTVLIADVERATRAKVCADELRMNVLGVRLGDVDLQGVDRWEDRVLLGNVLPALDVHPEDGATILYTSGTTGQPKGAFSTHRAITQSLMGLSCRSAVERLRKPHSRDHTTCFILVVPLFHVTGLVPVMLGSFMGGLKLVMMYRWNPERALELIERESVTNLVGVAAQAVDLLESPRLSDFDTSSLLMVAGGGAPVPPTVVSHVEDTFERARPGIGYGMTETNAFGPSNSGDDYLIRPASAGRVLPIMTIEIRDPDGKALGTGSTGEIWMKSPTLIRGYWNNPSASSATLVDGWLRSGDLGHLDREGFLFVEDRIKDVVIRGGENIYCVEVEAALAEHPAVLEAAVFGVPHDRLGEEVAAAIVLRQGFEVRTGELLEFVALRLARFKVPTSVQIYQELPRNAAGKVVKAELRNTFAGNT